MIIMEHDPLHRYRIIQPWLAGLQYKDLREGSGEAARDGSKVTIDWDGYTIGYYGRPFEGRNKVSCQLTVRSASSSPLTQLQC